jgi:hypothetical protein
MKSNKEKNIEYDARMQARVRPKPREFDYKPLEDVIRQWILRGKNERLRA